MNAVAELTPEAVSIAAGLVPDPQRDLRLPGLARDVAKLLEVARGPRYAALYKRASALSSAIVLGFDAQLEGDHVASKYVLRPEALAKTPMVSGVVETWQPDWQQHALMVKFDSLAEVSNWIESQERAQWPAADFYRLHDEDELRKAVSTQVQRASKGLRRAAILSAEGIDTRYGSEMRVITGRVVSLRFNDLNTRLRAMNPPEELNLLFFVAEGVEGGGELVQWFSRCPAHMIVRDASRFDWHITPLRPGDEGLHHGFDSLDAAEAGSPEREVLLTPHTPETQAWLFSAPLQPAPVRTAGSVASDGGAMLSEYETNAAGHPVRVVTQRISKERQVELEAQRSATKGASTA